MAKLTLAELTTPMTRQEVQEKIYLVLQNVGVNTTIWKSGSVVRTMIAASSLVMAAFTELMANIAQGGFLALASGDWLTLVAQYVYNIERIEEDFARGNVTLSNAGGGVYTIDPGDLIVASEVTGQTYVNTAVVNIAALETGVVVPVEAVEAGTAANADPSTITVMVTVYAGITCTNPTGLVGVDRELDEALRTRCSESLGALSPLGPWDAYNSALRGADVGVTRIRLQPDGYGRVYIWIASASGGISPGDVAIADEAVQQNATPQAITAIVASAVEVPIAVTYSVWLYNTSGLTEDQIKDTIEAALQDYVSTQPVGGNVVAPDPGRVYTSALSGVIKGAMPEIFRVEVTAPVDYVSLDIDEVPVLVDPVVTAVTQVPPPEGYRPT
jgi:uncharacterized phage protein gp47/JayE